MRSSRGKALVKIAKWDKNPSGSGAKAKAKPMPYKYAAEMDFLDNANADATTDNLEVRDNSDVEVASTISGVSSFIYWHFLKFLI